MQFDAHCVECLVHRHHRLAMEKGDGEKAFSYIKDVMQIILDAPDGVSAPWLTGAFTNAYAKYWPGEDAYAQLKQDSNDLVLELLPKIRPLVERAEDPLAMAMQFARTGNFLDFGVLTPDVAHKALWEAVEKTPQTVMEPNAYAALKRDMETAERLVILGDNAGEIVFDMLLVEQLQKQYPALAVTYCVRGANTMNDATREDAAYVGMDRLCPVIDNGSSISGTELDYIGEELKAALDTADIILSKGSGNMESLVGCGLNVYYIFMCKCKRMAKILGCEDMSAQFLREKDLPPMEPLCGSL
ncbi:MAG: DUF89 family protein [Oscillospiraceae bacterium]|nr:DUF89 family protein [Oscillospiraceae bacterium]